jgi:hypothetical protein
VRSNYFDARSDSVAVRSNCFAVRVFLIDLQPEPLNHLTSN